MTDWISIGEAAEKIGVSVDTIRRMCNDGRLEFIQNTPKSHRRINITKYMEEQKANQAKKYIYARINTNGPQSELDKQIADLKCDEDEYLKMTDIESKENILKVNALELAKLALTGKMSELVIAHKNIIGDVIYEIVKAGLDKPSVNGKIIDKNLPEWAVDKIYPPAININIIVGDNNSVNNSTNTNNTAQINSNNNVAQQVNSNNTNANNTNANNSIANSNNNTTNNMVRVIGDDNQPIKMSLSEAKKQNKKLYDFALPIPDEYKLETYDRWIRRCATIRKYMSGTMTLLPGQEQLIKTWINAQKNMYHSSCLENERIDILSDIPNWDWYRIELIDDF